MNRPIVQLNVCQKTVKHQVSKKRGNLAFFEFKIFFQNFLKDFFRYYQWIVQSSNRPMNRPIVQLNVCQKTVKHQVSKKRGNLAFFEFKIFFQNFLKDFFSLLSMNGRAKHLSFFLQNWNNKLKRQIPAEIWWSQTGRFLRFKSIDWLICLIIFVRWIDLNEIQRCFATIFFDSLKNFIWFW